jgi:hypothetical protein
MAGSYSVVVTNPYGCATRSSAVLTTLAGTGLPIPISDNGLTNALRFYRVRVR